MKRREPMDQKALVLNSLCTPLEWMHYGDVSDACAIAVVDRMTGGDSNGIKDPHHIDGATSSVY